ncbi:bifunctional diaminohydroxyphosphoribosylaminopyrimidine deaminase/5-amino-6-(5-phosphoribosylamino)uracil reductase RibD [Cytophagales bacterium RKSG123]|nr:bifunctional diaminohydroxyphosphoribosylaminopyrimidine deaminase/5-amino-6-(5-phosphoribosylamino)uracil reductase RibD [Xanthovirga aplysinae]
MQRALELATNGRGNVSPNPMVGCVIVYENKIIGEGWHQQYGGPHAEVNAVNAVPNKNLLPKSTVYVTLEPCAHFGKTPPCADLLVKCGVKRVVIGCKDTHPEVGGKGIEKLRVAGIEVKIGVLEEECLKLNRRFFTFLEKKRPYIILKWAETADGFIARENYDSKWISNEFSRQLVHKWRAEEDSILVGSNTAQFDDSQLNVRDWSGKDPLRIVIDRQLKLNPTLKLFDRSQPTICYNLKENREEVNLLFQALEGKDFLEDMLNDLFKRKQQSLIVEGGSGLLNKFIEKGLWDEARVFKAPTTFGKGIAAPILNGTLVDRFRIDNDQLFIFKPKW